MAGGGCGSADGGGCVICSLWCGAEEAFTHIPTWSQPALIFRHPSSDGVTFEASLAALYDRVLEPLGLEVSIQSLSLSLCSLAVASSPHSIHSLLSSSCLLRNQVLRVAKVPYLCRGDSAKAYYTLADAILVLRPSERSSALQIGGGGARGYGAALARSASSSFSRGGDAAAVGVAITPGGGQEQAGQDVGRFADDSGATATTADEGFTLR